MFLDQLILGENENKASIKCNSTSLYGLSTYYAIKHKVIKISLQWKNFKKGTKRNYEILIFQCEYN